MLAYVCKVYTCTGLLTHPKCCIYLVKSLSSRWTSGLKMEYYLLRAVILLTLLVTKVQGKTTTNGWGKWSTDTDVRKRKYGSEKKSRLSVSSQWWIQRGFHGTNLLKGFENTMRKRTTTCTYILPEALGNPTEASERIKAKVFCRNGDVLAISMRTFIFQRLARITSCFAASATRSGVTSLILRAPNTKNNWGEPERAPH